MESDNLWFREHFTDNLIYSYRVKEVLASVRTKFQKVDVLNLHPFGKTLFLDGKIQSAEIDEYIYHEMLVHPAMLFHPSPANVLIIGGGEGATLREVLKYPVKRVTMVDIDKKLVELCRTHLPEWSNGAFEDGRSTIMYRDALDFVSNYSGEPFDVVISDLTEPVEDCPSIKLFTIEFFEKVKSIMSENGIIVSQSGSADMAYNIFYASLNKTFKKVFRHVYPYYDFVYSFQMNWGYQLGSKSIGLKETLKEMKEREKSFKKSFSYFNVDYFLSKTILPAYLKKSLKKGKVIEEKNPFIWQA